LTTFLYFFFANHVTWSQSATTKDMNEKFTVKQTEEHMGNENVV